MPTVVGNNVSSSVLVFVTAPIVLKTAAMTKRMTKLIRKKMKNCEGAYRSPAKKYRMTLKATARVNLIGISLTIPAIASVDG